MDGAANSLTVLTWLEAVRLSHSSLVAAESEDETLELK